MQDLRDHDCEMLTLGQYLQPSREHLPVERFVTPRSSTSCACSVNIGLLQRRQRADGTLVVSC